MKIGTTLFALFCSGFLLTGCRSSPYIQAFVRDQGPVPVKLVEVDYPSASFGVQQIAAHSVFHYRFKVQGSGAISVTFVGQENKTFTVAGPVLHDGQRGTLEIDLSPAGAVQWVAALKSQPPV